MRKFSLWMACILLVVSLPIGCVKVAPRATVELSEIVDAQIREMQRSHEEFVGFYYNKLREEINTFIVEKWIPAFLAKTLAGETEQGKQLRKDIDFSYKLMKVDPKAVSIMIDSQVVKDEDVQKAIREAVQKVVDEQKAELAAVMLGFSKGTQEQVNIQRADMITPINEQEAFVLSELRDGYAELLRGNSAIRGYLASVVKVVEERDEILRKTGLLKTQQNILDTAVKANDNAVLLMKDATDFMNVICDFKKKMDETKKNLEKIKKEGSSSSGKKATK